MLFAAQASFAEPVSDNGRALPEPRVSGGKPVLDAMKLRASGRSYDGARKVDDALLSTILWTAAGINRPDGKRTAASTRNYQAVEVYAVLPDGIYRYNAAENSIERTASGDFRAITGMQEFAADASVNLVYVADMDKMKVADVEARWKYIGADVGLMSQNVYLFCASEGMSTVIRGAFDPGPLEKAMKLPQNKKAVMTQSVGWAK